MVEKTHAHLNYDGDLLQRLAKGYNAQARTLIHTHTLTCELSSFTHSTHFTESLPKRSAYSAVTYSRGQGPGQRDPTLGAYIAIPARL